MNFLFIYFFVIMMDNRVFVRKTTRTYAIAILCAHSKYDTRLGQIL